MSNPSFQKSDGINQKKTLFNSKIFKKTEPRDPNLNVVSFPVPEVTIPLDEASTKLRDENAMPALLRRLRSKTRQLKENKRQLKNFVNSLDDLDNDIIEQFADLRDMVIDEFASLHKLLDSVEVQILNNVIENLEKRQLDVLTSQKTQCKRLFADFDDQEVDVDKLLKRTSRVLKNKKKSSLRANSKSKTFLFGRKGEILSGVSSASLTNDPNGTTRTSVSQTSSNTAQSSAMVNPTLKSNETNPDLNNSPIEIQPQNSNVPSDSDTPDIDEPYAKLLKQLHIAARRVDKLNIKYSADGWVPAYTSSSEINLEKSSQKPRFVPFSPNIPRLYTQSAINIGLDMEVDAQDAIRAICGISLVPVDSSSRPNKVNGLFSSKRPTNKKNQKKPFSLFKTLRRPIESDEDNDLDAGPNPIQRQPRNFIRTISNSSINSEKNPLSDSSMSPPPPNSSFEGEVSSLQPSDGQTFSLSSEINNPLKNSSQSLTPHDQKNTNLKPPTFPRTPSTASLVEDVLNNHPLPASRFDIKTQFSRPPILVPNESSDHLSPNQVRVYLPDNSFETFDINQFTSFGNLKANMKLDDPDDTVIYLVISDILGNTGKKIMNNSDSVSEWNLTKWLTVPFPSLSGENAFHRFEIWPKSVLNTVNPRKLIDSGPKKSISRVDYTSEFQQYALHLLNLIKNNSPNKTVEYSHPIIPRQLNPASQRQVPSVSLKDFHFIKHFAHGAFAQVYLVSKIDDPGSLFALKRLSKQKMIQMKQVRHVENERNFLAQLPLTNPWVVALQFAFEDKDHLYFVMDYLSGGDLMGLVMSHHIFSEDQARFYIAEIVLAIHSIHALNYVHRDVKPDNILIDSKGHIKLTDFGLCSPSGADPQPHIRYVQRLLQRRPEYSTNLSKKSRSFLASSINSPRQPISTTTTQTTASSAENQVNQVKFAKTDVVIAQETQQNPESTRSTSSQHARNAWRNQKMMNRKQGAYSVVGTPNYMAPEVLKTGLLYLDSNAPSDVQNPGYSHMVDWWSLGVLLFELLYGYPPFHSEDDITTFEKILDWPSTLVFPTDIQVSPQAKNLICRLLTDPRNRADFADIKAHEWFKDVPWNSIRSFSPPFVPVIQDTTGSFQNLTETSVTPTGELPLSYPADLDIQGPLPPSDVPVILSESPERVDSPTEATPLDDTVELDEINAAITLSRGVKNNSISKSKRTINPLEKPLPDIDLGVVTQQISTDYSIYPSPSDPLPSNEVSTPPFPLIPGFAFDRYAGPQPADNSLHKLSFSGHQRTSDNSILRVFLSDKSHKSLIIDTETTVEQLKKTIQYKLSIEGDSSLVDYSLWLVISDSSTSEIVFLRPLRDNESPLIIRQSWFTTLMRAGGPLIDPKDLVGLDECLFFYFSNSPPVLGEVFHIPT